MLRRWLARAHGPKTAWPLSSGPRWRWLMAMQSRAANCGGSGRLADRSDRCRQCRTSTVYPASTSTRERAALTGVPLLRPHRVGDQIVVGRLDPLCVDEHRRRLAQTHSRARSSRGCWLEFVWAGGSQMTSPRGAVRRMASSSVSAERNAGVKENSSTRCVTDARRAVSSMRQMSSGLVEGDAPRVGHGLREAPVASRASRRTASRPGVRAPA